MVDKINTELKNVYTELFPQLSKQIFTINNNLSRENKATNPLLLKVDQKYIDAKIKIMFFGQETNHWHTEKDGTGQFHGEIEPLLDLYEHFYLENRCYSYGGQFWNGINRFKQHLKLSEIDKSAFVWNNVVKIGKCGKGNPIKEVLDIQKHYFNVITTEIEILRPNYLVFFSGPNYDYLIKELITPVGFSAITNFKERQLCILETPFNIRALRTYHPNFLWRNDINKYFEEIIVQMNK